MARVEPKICVAEPPTWLSLSHIPDKSVKDAVEWYWGIGVTTVTERWLKAVTDRRELACRIIAGRRMYSTAELWRFIVTRPSRTAGAARYNNQRGKGQAHEPIRDRPEPPSHEIRHEQLARPR